MFPTVLLVATLLRLALNVASTRVVLLNGHTGTGAAGKVIEAFGEFVVGGNYAVGLVVFAILVIINFVVVTKGAGRISEVSARFTLDAMPGKQMAIDADLNAGLITQDEARAGAARKSREEADFYGSMDGASKFVRGDAIAGILILFINIIGGLAIGIAAARAAMARRRCSNYTLLTIGDGLVAQIPSLLLSTAVAIIVTRVSRAQDLGEQVISQLFGHRQRAGGHRRRSLVLLGLIPGMPNVAFLMLAAAVRRLAPGCCAGAAKRRRPEPVSRRRRPARREPAELGWDDVAPVDVIGLEVGYRLIPLVDRTQGGELLGRIKGVRKKLSQELGFLVPPVHIRDNLELAPNAYRIVAPRRAGRRGRGASGPRAGDQPGPGVRHRDRHRRPGTRPSVWTRSGSSRASREHAQTLGYTVVDASTVIATHLSQLLQDARRRTAGPRGSAAAARPRGGRPHRSWWRTWCRRRCRWAVVVKVLQNLLVGKDPDAQYAHDRRNSGGARAA